MEHFIKYTLQKEHIKCRKTKITNERQLANFARKLYQNDIGIYETVYLITIDNSGVVNGYAKLAQGGTGNCIIDDILILKYMIESLCKRCILVHNHPCGNPTPSDSDILYTKRIQQKMQIMNFDLLDHVILTEKKYYSFSKENIL